MPLHDGGFFIFSRMAMASFITICLIVNYWKCHNFEKRWTFLQPLKTIQLTSRFNKSHEMLAVSLKNALNK